MTRQIETSDLWSAIRGLGLFRKGEVELEKIRAAHAGVEMFASAVIVRAVDEVRAVRKAQRIMP